MARGIDTNTSCASVAPCLKQNGIDFVGRYYANCGSKVLTLAEAQALSAAGLQIVAVWEDGYPTQGSYFSYVKGVDDGTSAFHDAQSLGQPKNAPIYFSVDYNAPQADIAGPIQDYFRGIRDGFATIAAAGASYPVGVYGSGAVCQSMLDAGLASYAWLSESTGFSGSKTFAAWNIKQSLASAPLCGLSIDTDEGAADYGGFTIA